jgi:NAD+ synthase (glutamine-hydrolysing)
MIAPELALSGYPPEDLLLRPAFYTAAAAALDALADALREFDGLAVLVGHPLRSAAGEAAGGEPPSMVMQTARSSAACRRSTRTTRRR